MYLMVNNKSTQKYTIKISYSIQKCTWFSDIIATLIGVWYITYGRPES